jgi:DMSO/TMAO reductase YedYZ heme-binding membrane subunit
VPTTVSRSRGRQGVHSGAQGATGDHMRKIMATLITASVVIIFVLVGTKAGHTIDAATQHFMLYYAGVLALVGLTGSVLLGLVATDRIVMTPGHRVMAQAVHRAFAFGTLAFLIIHITTEVLAQRSHAIDAVIPFLSPYRTFYIGLGTIASDLIVLLVVTSILRKRFTGHGRAWQWRAIHYSSYVAFVFGVLHGLLGGREAKPYVDWSYGFAIAVTALGLAVRFLAISLRPKESVGPAPSVDRARPSGSSPLHAAAMSMAQAQLGGTVQVLPAGMGARGAPIGVPGPGPWAAAALPAPGWSPSSGPMPALDPAPAYAGPSSSSDAYRDLGFKPLGAPLYSDDVPNGMRGRPYLGVDQSRPSRQPLYEPGYDGPPRFEGAPRGHGDVPADELSSYPYGPQGHWQQPAAPYVDDYPDRAGSEGRAGARPGWPESGRPRAAISPPPRPEDRSPGPMPTLGTGPMPQLGTRPMPRPEGAAMPRPDTGPIPRVGNGQVPRAGTGPMPRGDTGLMPRNGTGPMPRAGTGPMPRANSGPMPRLGTGPMPRPEGAAMPRPDTDPMPRAGNGQVPRNGTGPMPRAGTGPMPRANSGPMPRAGTGPMPRANSGPMPRAGTGPMPRPGTGPMPRANSGPMPGLGTGPMPRPDTGAMARPDTGPIPQVETGPLPWAGGGLAGRPGPGAMPQPGPDPASRPETGPLPRLGPGPMSRTDTGPMPRPGTGPGPWPGQPAPPADPAAGPRTGPLPRAADRPSRRAKSNDPRYRDIPGPTGGEEWE